MYFILHVYCMYIVVSNIFWYTYMYFIFHVYCMYIAEFVTINSRMSNAEAGFLWDHGESEARQAWEGTVTN